LRVREPATPHPEQPAIVVLPLESVEKSYLGWLLAETDDAAK